MILHDNVISTPILINIKFILVKELAKRGTKSELMQHTMMCITYIHTVF